MARGLVFNPDGLLLDEPLGALDKNLREQMQVEIKRIHRELNITMIYVTHDQTEAMTMSDRVAVFGNGQLAQVGTPLDVYHRPATRFVAEFIGDSNIFPESSMPRALASSTLPASAQCASLARISSGEVDLMIRPERLRQKPDGGTLDDNEFEMTVDDIINYGDSILAIGKIRGLPIRPGSPAPDPKRWSPARSFGSAGRRRMRMSSRGAKIVTVCPATAMESAMAKWRFDRGRRRFLRAAGAAAALGPLLISERTIAQTRTLYVNSWGGSYTAAQEAAYSRPSPRRPELRCVR